MYRGKLVPGNHYKFTELITDQDRFPIVPLVPPTISFYYQSSSLVVSSLMSRTKDIKQIGTFEYDIWFDASIFNPATWFLGYYIAVIEWVANGLAMRKRQTFELVNGGHQYGNVCSMNYYRCPQGNFLLGKTTSGIIQKGKNPR